MFETLAGRLKWERTGNRIRVEIPAQDLLEAGSEARMNTPAVAAGNWSWRAPEGCWTAETAQRLAALVEVTDRDNDPLGEAEETEEEG